MIRRIIVRAGRVLVSCLPILAATLWREFKPDVDAVYIAGAIPLAAIISAVGKYLREKYPDQAKYIPF